MGVCLEPEKLCIITELMSRGSLYDLLRDPQVELPYSVQVRMALDCLKGLQFIHSAGFIHRDLKYIS
jgi:sterile alpha motif and leucine zipper-containing kinase AZK